MAIVVFVPADFKAAYPEFAAVSDARLEYFFLQAEIIVQNTDYSLVWRDNVRKILLWSLVAHLAQLAGVLDDSSGGGSGLQPVGRISAAREGSVSTEFGYTGSNNAQWFLQTQYGATYWELSASARTARYIPHPTVY